MASLKRGVIGGKFRRLMIIMWLVFRIAQRQQLVVERVEELQLTILTSIYTIKSPLDPAAAATVVDDDLLISDYISFIKT